MFACPTLPLLAAVLSLTCGSSVGAEAFDPSAAPPGLTLHRSPPSSRTPGIAVRDTIAPWPSNALRTELLAWPGSAARTAGRLGFDRDGERAGSSASISLGRLNLNEARSGPALGASSQANLDRELAHLRDGIDRARLAPTVSLGVRIRF